MTANVSAELTKPSATSPIGWPARILQRRATCLTAKLMLTGTGGAR